MRAVHACWNGTAVTIRIGVLISGSGTNLQAIIDAVDAGALDAQVAVVISSRPEAYGLKRAAAAGIPVVALSKETYDDRDLADEGIATLLREHRVDYVVLAGYMRMVGLPLLMSYEDHIVNIHPALLPSFPGAHGIVDARAYGVKLTGVTVHFANASYDEGPILVQRPVEVLEDDTDDTLAERIHEVEHRLYPEALQLLADGRVRIERNGHGRRVCRILPKNG